MKSEKIKARLDAQPKKVEAIPTILDTAKEIVYGDRAAAYGHPQANFLNISQLWNAYLAIKVRATNDLPILTPHDVAMFNVLQKVARSAVNPSHMDTLVDIAGYAGAAERIIKQR